MLFIPSIIVFVVFKQSWVKTIAAILWIVGFITSVEIWPIYLISTTICYVISASIVWVIRKEIELIVIVIGILFIIGMLMAIGMWMGYRYVSEQDDIHYQVCILKHNHEGNTSPIYIGTSVIPN